MIKSWNWFAEHKSVNLLFLIIFIFRTWLPSWLPCTRCCASFLLSVSVQVIKVRIFSPFKQHFVVFRSLLFNTRSGDKTIGEEYKSLSITGTDTKDTQNFQSYWDQHNISLIFNQGFWDTQNCALLPPFWLLCCYSLEYWNYFHLMEICCVSYNGNMSCLIQYRYVVLNTI